MNPPQNPEHKHPQREDWRERLRGLMSGYFTVSQMEELIATVESNAHKETAKAYGGCTTCYGKGYSTEQQGSIGSAHHKIRGPELVYNPCKKCDRGTQIEKMLEAARRAVIGEVEKVIPEIEEIIVDSEGLTKFAIGSVELHTTIGGNAGTRRAVEIIRALLSNLKDV